MVRGGPARRSAPRARGRRPASRPGIRWIDLEAGSSLEVSFRLDPRSPTHKNKDGQPYGSYE
jgi:hypothetical protein